MRLNTQLIGPARVGSSVLLRRNKESRTGMLGHLNSQMLSGDSTRHMLFKQEGIGWKGDSLQQPQRVSAGGQSALGSTAKGQESPPVPSSFPDRLQPSNGHRVPPGISL